MREAGLTYGAFYGAFSSKEESIAEASARALTSTFALLSKESGRRAGDPLSAVANSYLSRSHRDDPGTGCLLAALGPDVSRQDHAVRRTVTDYVRSAVDLLTTLIPGST